MCDGSNSHCAHGFECSDGGDWMSALGNEYLPIAYLPGASGRSTGWEPIANVLAHRREAFLFAYPGLGDVPDHQTIRSLSDLVQWVASELPERCDVVALS